MLQLASFPQRYYMPGMLRVADSWAILPHGTMHDSPAKNLSFVLRPRLSMLAQ
jgi:hypothetical protein